MDNKYKISYIREYELYEFGYVIQPGDKYVFPKGYTYYELDALKFVTSEFNCFEDDCFIEPLHGTGLLFVCNNNNINIYMIDKPICIKGGIVFLFVASHGNLQFSLAANDVAKTIEIAIPVELPPLEKGMTIDAVHQVNYIEKKANKHINTMHHILYEILYVDKGGLICKFNSLVKRISAGQIFIIDKNTRYHLESENENTAFVSIVFNTKSPLSGLLLNRVLPSNSKIIRKFKNIIRESEDASQFYLDIVISELNILLVELIRSLGKGGKYEPSPGNIANDERKSEMVQKVLNFIDENITAGDLRVENIGAKFFLTASYLSKIFKTETGKTISEYKRDKRLEISKRALLEGNLSVSEVAEMMNYCSVHYFSSEFKKKYGYPPSEYANMIK